MAEWEKEIAELKTDVKYIREDIGIMQKQVRDLKQTHEHGPWWYKSFIIGRSHCRWYMDYYENHGRY